MIHLTAADYVRQPWKNGRGITTELWRLEQCGQLAVRLSRASVVEDGPFSLLPGIARNLTVLTGPGFRLVGDGHDFRCDPLMPVAFSGDVALTATETGGQQSDDFNVMTADHMPRPEVLVTQNVTLPEGGFVALYALGSVLVNGRRMARDDLVLTKGSVTLTGDWPILAARFHGLADI